MKRIAALLSALALLSACQLTSGASELTPLGPSLVEMTATASTPTATRPPRPTATITQTPSPTQTLILAVTAPHSVVVPVRGGLTASAPEPVTPTPCPNTWFTHLGTIGWCANTNPDQLEAAWQTFEHGALLWRKERGYIVLPFDPATRNQTGIVSFYPDAVTIYRDTSAEVGQPPEGLFAPVSGFGLLWRGDIFEQPSSGFRSVLGWATAPEVGYTVTEQGGTQQFLVAQAHLTGLVTILTLPDGRVIRLSRYALPNQPTSLGFFGP